MSEKEDKIINVTNNYQIFIDSRNYTVQKLCEIDPSRFPTFNPEKDDPTIRHEWKEDGYFGINDFGLECAIKRIILGEANERIENKTELREYINLIRDVAEEIHMVVGKQMSK